MFLCLSQFSENLIAHFLAFLVAKLWLFMPAVGFLASCLLFFIIGPLTVTKASPGACRCYSLACLSPSELSLRVTLMDSSESDCQRQSCPELKSPCRWSLQWALIIQKLSGRISPPGRVRMLSSTTSYVGHSNKLENAQRAAVCLWDSLTGEQEK